MSEFTKWPIGNITVGNRARRDLGDIKKLASEIAEIGLLHPIVVRPDGMLIAGRRRLEACRQLKWPEVPVHVVDIADAKLGEAMENAARKDFLPSEAAAIARQLWAAENQRARDRQGARTDLRENFPDAEAGRVRDLVARTVGMSGRSLQKVFAVIDAASANPAQFGSLLEEMDRTGKIDGTFRRLEQMKKPATASTGDTASKLPDDHPLIQAIVALDWILFEPRDAPAHVFLSKREEFMEQLDFARACLEDALSLAQERKRRK